MPLPQSGAHTDGVFITEGEDDKEDASNLLDALLDNMRNQPTTFDVTAGGTFNLNTPAANLDQYLESSLLRIIGTPPSGVTIIVPDGNKNIAFEAACGQTVTIDTVTGAASPVVISTGATKTMQIRGIQITITADDATETGALLHDGSQVVTGDQNFADFELARALLKDYAEAYTAPAAAGTIDLDLELGNTFEAEMDQNTTFTFSNPPATGRAGSFTLILKQDSTGGWLPTWPGSVAWEGGSPPTFSTAIDAIDVVSFFTVNAGSTWFGFPGGKNFQ